MKKKFLASALIVLIIATAAIGGSLAYFTDTADASNVFTTGDVKIELIEVFDPANAKLIPGVDIQKEVYVKNTGSEESYVRVHIAYPSILDDGLPGLEAFKNKLHWNFSKESVQEGQWSQLQNKDQNGPNADYPNWPGNGGKYNTYTAVIDNIPYNVYVYTYETALPSGVTTSTPAISKVYLDTSITNEDVTEILGELGQIKVLVFAEAGQKAGFTDAYTALNTQFGDPMAAAYTAPWNR